MKSCYIVGAADFAPARFAPAPGDFVIAADAGILHLERLGAKPDLVLGDFDSLGRVPDYPDTEISPVRTPARDTPISSQFVPVRPPIASRWYGMPCFSASATSRRLILRSSAAEKPIIGPPPSLPGSSDAPGCDANETSTAMASVGSSA